MIKENTLTEKTTNILEAITHTCSVKKVFLEISQNLLKKRLCHRCFPVNFAKFLITPFLTEHLQWLLLTFLQTFSVM